MAATADYPHGTPVLVSQHAPSSVAPASANRSAVRHGVALYRWGARWNRDSDYFAIAYPDGSVVVASGSMLTICTDPECEA